MRLWSLHPSLLGGARDWLPCGARHFSPQTVLTGTTTGYRLHPQFVRFRQARQSIRAIANYLWSVADEAKERG